MAEVTVKQLADTVGAPVDRLLKQMQQAGLSHKAEDEAVSEQEKQTLLAYLKGSHGEASKPAEKITLKRKSTGTLKSGQGRTGRNVTVEVRRKRTYVKRSEAAPEVNPEPNEPVFRKANWKRSVSKKRKRPVKKLKKKRVRQKLSARQRPSVAPMKKD